MDAYVDMYRYTYIDIYPWYTCAEFGKLKLKNLASAKPQSSMGNEKKEKSHEQVETTEKEKNTHGGRKEKKK